MLSLKLKKPPSQLNSLTQERLSQLFLQGFRSFWQQGQILTPQPSKYLKKGFDAAEEFNEVNFQNEEEFSLDFSQGYKGFWQHRTIPNQYRSNDEYLKGFFCAWGFFDGFKLTKELEHICSEVKDYYGQGYKLGKQIRLKIVYN